MEFSGIVFALVVAVVLLYALPASISRRAALVASREGDRFAPEVDLLQPHLEPTSRRSYAARNEASRMMSPPSTRPLLAAGHAASSEGTTMSDKEETPAVPASRDSGLSRRTPSRTQQLAALRARRVARLARETAAVQRRIVGAVASSVLLLVFTAIAAFGAMSWSWLFLPAGMLLATVVSSVVGSVRAQRQNAAEIAELEAIKGMPAHQANVRGAAERKRKKEPTEERVSSQAPTSPEMDSALPNEDDPAITEPADVEEQQGASAKPVATANSAASFDLPAAVENRQREWDVVSLPPVRGNHSDEYRTRRVHADTDLVPVMERRTSGVPARPIRKSDQAATAKVAAELTGPTFRFDLDAVLDERRAQ